MYANLLGILVLWKTLLGIGGSWIVFHWGLRFKVLDSAGDESLEYSGSAGDREFFRNLTLMGILKFNSAGDMYFKVLALLRI